MKALEKGRNVCVLLLGIVMAISLSACSGSAQSESSENAAAKTGASITEQNTGTENASVPAAASDNIIYAASAAIDDVRAAIKLVKDGGVVRVPAGSADWSGGISVSKSISLQGRGVDLTNISNPSIGINAENINLDGFTFTGGRLNVNKADFRIHDNRFIATKEIITINKVYGLIDNNRFDFSTDSAEMIWCYGPDDSWSTPDSFGTADAVYFEDNTWTTAEGLERSQCVQGNYNSRFVFRYNTVMNCKVDAHGIWSNGDPAQYGNWDHPTIHSCRHYEIYRNHFRASDADANYQCAMELRGGTGIVFNNEFTGSSLNNSSGWPAIVLQEYLTSESNTMNGCGYYLTPDRYPGHGQLGRGMDEELQPLYLWNNTVNGQWFDTSRKEPCQGAIDQYGSSFSIDDIIKKNREYYEYTANFDGTAGVGVGTISNRPATCTPGVGYWATDENILYKSTAADTWEQYYTPFAYPHPLRAGSTEPAQEGSK